MSTANKGSLSPPSRRGISRRETFLRGLGLLGGGFAASTLLRSQACLERPRSTGLVANPLEMAEAELLCQGEILLAVAETSPGIPKMDRVLLRLIGAALERFSLENDLLAARCLLLLAANGAAPQEAARLAASAPERSALRVAWERIQEREVGR